MHAPLRKFVILQKTPIIIKVWSQHISSVHLFSQEAGYKVTIASPKGEITLDKVSLEGDAVTAETKKWLEDGAILLPRSRPHGNAEYIDALSKNISTCFTLVQGGCMARDGRLAGCINRPPQRLQNFCR